MSYEEFNDSSFDLNHDGEIDCSEASYIEDTIYGENNDSMEDDEDDLYIGYATGHTSVHKEHQTLEDIKPKVQNEESLSDLIVGLVVIVLLVTIMVILGLAMS